MMENMDDLYQEVIIDHNKRPRNFGHLDDATVRVEGMNPLCGDEITLYLRLDDDKVLDVSFEGHGCAISRSSASIMTESIKGRSRADVEALFETFHELVTHHDRERDLTSLGKLAVFAGVGEYPARVKCASLAWHTLRNGLHGSRDTVTTE